MYSPKTLAKKRELYEKNRYFSSNQDHRDFVMFADDYFEALRAEIKEAHDEGFDRGYDTGTSTPWTRWTKKESFAEFLKSQEEK